MSAAPGWYDDPSQSGQLRYWDGQRWTEHTHVNAAPAPTPVPSTSVEQGFATPGMSSAVPGEATTSPQPAYATVSQAYTPDPYLGPTYSPRRRLGAGAIVGIVVGALVLVGLIGAGIVWGLAGLAGEPQQSGTAVEATTPTPADDIESQEPTTELGRAEHADIPADYAVPEGYVELRHPDVGVVYGVPPEWFDVTELYRPYFGEEPELTGGELVTFLEAWTPDTGDGTGTDEVLVLHSELPRSYTTELYSIGARRGFDYTAGAQTWSEARTYSNDVGMSVTVTSGTPVESGTFLSTHMYVIGGGESMVLIQCTSYVESGNCAAVEDAVATMWVG